MYDQISWEYLKCEIRKFSIHFSVSEAKKEKKKKQGNEYFRK